MTTWCVAGHLFLELNAREAGRFTRVPTIPPRKNARLSRGKDPPPLRAECNALLRRLQEDGRYYWQLSSAAARQSLTEHAHSRPRSFESQQVWALLKGRVLNRKAALGVS